MWNIRVRLSAEEFSGNLEGEVLEGAEEVVGRAADRTVERVKSLLSRPFAGRPTEPGSPPLKRRGDLAASVRRTPVESDGKRIVSSRVIVDDEGAGRLEFGAVDKRGIRTFPHPFLRPAFEEMQDEIDDMLREWAGS